MNEEKFAVVVTTIQGPTPAMRKLARQIKKFGGKLIVAGDKKGPTEYPLAGVELLTLEQQLKLPFKLAPLLPVGHYVRKNLGYLAAIHRGAPCLYETDDDNAPMSNWEPRGPEAKAIPVRGSRWRNVYQHFTDEPIWPRGFPLEELEAARKWKPLARGVKTIFCPIQQGLADGNPDVDAVWRLILTRDIRFKARPSLALGRGAWCPFNSQNTWWWPAAYPLLYLPSYCTFRMTDIWRSFVAQRCLWELGGALAFHAADVVQDRNVHNLLRDFQDEVPGYLNNARIREVLEKVELKRGPESAGENLRSCYEALVRAGILPEKELPLVEAWLSDCAVSR